MQNKPYNTSNTITFSIYSSDLQVAILLGDRKVSYLNDLIIEAQADDPNTENESDSDITYVWQCIDVSTNLPCKYING